jgi:uncharacterized protein (DUF58 family)
MRPDLLEAPTSIFVILFIQTFIFICLFFALLYDVAELALFAIIIHTMAFVSYLWARASLNHVNCKITPNRTRLFPGGKLKIDIRAINSKFLPILFKVDLFAPGAIAGSETDQWISEEAGLLWYQQFVFSREFFPNRRGVYDLGFPMLRVGDPFGFFFRNKQVTDRFEVIVYPRIANIRPVTLPKREYYGIPGAWSPVEDPIFILGTRDYQPGRPSRRIHWKVSARHNRLQEKLCEPAEQEKIFILLDVDQFENEQAIEDFERSLEVIAALVLQMNRRRIAVGFATNGNMPGGGSNIIPISRSTQQIEFFLESLARIGVKKVGLITDILARGYQIPRGVSSIYFACNNCGQLRSARAFMRHRSIPVRFVLAQKLNDFEIIDGLRKEDIFYLDDILVPENRKK